MLSRLAHFPAPGVLALDEVVRTIIITLGIFAERVALAESRPERAIQGIISTGKFEQAFLCGIADVFYGSTINVRRPVDGVRQAMGGDGRELRAQFLLRY